MKQIILSAPFGNYLNWSNCTSTVGSYTLNYRGGFLYRLYRVLKTVRYYPGIQAWKNKLGLPNPGIINCPKNLSNKILSISARTTTDWLALFDYINNNLNPLAVELNVSCPNTGDIDITDYQEVFARKLNCEVIIKLPPVNYESIFSLAVSQGILSFHCCNTLPTPGGGLSGKPLKLLSQSCIKWINRQGKLNRVIGGGGVTTQEDIKEYLDIGATNVALGSVLFNPFLWKRFNVC